MVIYEFLWNSFLYEFVFWKYFKFFCREIQLYLATLYLVEYPRVIIKCLWASGRIFSLFGKLKRTILIANHRKLKWFNEFIHTFESKRISINGLNFPVYYKSYIYVMVLNISIFYCILSVLFFCSVSIYLLFITPHQPNKMLLTYIWYYSKTH